VPVYASISKGSDYSISEINLDFVVEEDFRLDKLGTEWAVDFSFFF